jgi:hypothetical protein
MELTHVSLVEPQSPPSTYAVAAFMDGVPGTWYRVLEVTTVRALFIGTGLFLAGYRGEQLLRGSLAGSAAITAWLMAGYRSGLLEKRATM